MFWPDAMFIYFWSQFEFCLNFNETHILSLSVFGAFRAIGNLWNLLKRTSFMQTKKSLLIRPHLRNNFPLLYNSIHCMTLWLIEIFFEIMLESPMWSVTKAKDWIESVPPWWIITYVSQNCKFKLEMINEWVVLYNRMYTTFLKIYNRIILSCDYRNN